MKLVEKYKLKVTIQSNLDIVYELLNNNLYLPTNATVSDAEARILARRHVNLVSTELNKL